jgi:hypothetical protein
MLLKLFLIFVLETTNIDIVAVDEMIFFAMSDSVILVFLGTLKWLIVGLTSWMTTHMFIILRNPSGFQPPLLTLNSLSS